MLNRKISFLFLLTVSFFINQGCSNKTLNCSKIKTGDFYFHPKGTDFEYLIVREGSLQKEVARNFKDTSYWQISWLNDCRYSLKYLSGGTYTNREKEVLVAHSVIVAIEGFGKNYYLIKGNIDSLPADRALFDTVWVNK